MAEIDQMQKRARQEGGRLQERIKPEGKVGLKNGDEVVRWQKKKGKKKRRKIKEEASHSRYIR